MKRKSTERSKCLTLRRHKALTQFATRRSSHTIHLPSQYSQRQQVLIVHTMDHSHQQRNDNPAYKEIPLTREDQKNYEYLFGTADDDFQGGATGTTMEPSVATAFPLLAPVHTALHLPSQTTTNTSVPRIQRIQLPAQLRNDGFFTGSYAQGASDIYVLALVTVSSLHGRTQMFLTCRGFYE